MEDSVMLCKSRSIAALLLALFIGQQVVAQEKDLASRGTPMYTQLKDIKLLGNLSAKHYQLPNGLQVAIVTDTTTPIFTYQTWFKTGSADEPAGRQGLAHLFEHMMFRKTKRREMGEFDRLVNVNGGRGTNAYTNRDQTVYFFTFPNDRLELAADLESDRMVNLVIDSTMFETEKGAVLTEKNRGLDDPTNFLWEEVYKRAYKHHNYKYSVIGEAESIKGFTVQEAVDFYKNFYAPNNALIIVVGDVRPESVMDHVAAKYGSYQASATKTREVTTEPPQAENITAVVSHPKATQQMMAKVWHIPNMVHPDYPALAMVGKLLTSGKTALLTERLLNKSKVTNLFSDAYISKDLGTFEFFAQLADGETFADIEKEFDESMAELAAGKISADQIRIVKNNILKETYKSVTSPAALARLLGDSYIYANDLAYEVNMPARIEKVTKDDIRRIVKKYILEGKSTTVQLVPEKKS
jgi:zinc protease